MTIDRRGFVRGMMAALAGAPVAVAATGEATTESGEPLTGDAALLGWCLQTFGDEPVCDGIATLLREGQFTVRELKRRLQRTKNKARRQAKSSKRRETHGGDEVLYRGPVELVQQFSGRECRSIHRRAVLVGATDQKYTIRGIGIPSAQRVPVAYRDDDLQTVTEPATATRDLTIPQDSRVLIDLRRGLADVMACEVVRTADGRTRLHLWRTAQDRPVKDGDTLPRLAGGVAYETTGEQPVVGLLGLPL